MEWFSLPGDPMVRRLVCLLGSCLLIPVFAGAQSQATRPKPRQNVAERPWTDDPTSPYYRAQVVAGERLRPTAPSIDFPVVDAPPGELPAVSGAQSGAAPAGGSRPNVLQRPWSDDPQSPHGRAQAVAAERVSGAAQPAAASPYPEKYRSPVPAPFRPRATERRWRGGLIYPALPFPAIVVR